MTTKVSSAYTEDFGLPLERGLEIFPIEKLGVLFLYFLFMNASYFDQESIYNLIYAILLYPILANLGVN